MMSEENGQTGLGSSNSNNHSL